MTVRVLLIGLDGATFRVLDPLMRDGEMPFLRGLVESGARSELRSVIPALTPPAKPRFSGCRSTVTGAPNSSASCAVASVLALSTTRISCTGSLCCSRLSMHARVSETPLKQGMTTEHFMPLSSALRRAKKNCPASSRTPGSGMGCYPSSWVSGLRQRLGRFAGDDCQLATSCRPDRRPTPDGWISPIQSVSVVSSPHSSLQIHVRCASAERALGSRWLLASDVSLICMVG